MPIAIMSAMREEIDALLKEMNSEQISVYGMRDYHRGKLWDVDCVLVFSRWGKVAAAGTTVDLISRFNVEQIIFTGVAGAAANDVKIGDIVVGTSLIQHDMDARPFFKQHEIPLLNLTEFPADKINSVNLKQAAQKYLEGQFPSDISAAIRSEFKIFRPRVIEGQIASGDKFFADTQALAELKTRLPEVKCVEMEGAAVAQVCYEHVVPFTIIRTISDSADHEAPQNFPRFVEEIASKYSHGILRNLLSERGRQRGRQPPFGLTARCRK